MVSKSTEVACAVIFAAPAGSLYVLYITINDKSLRLLRV